MSQTQENTRLDRLLDPVSRCLTAEAPRQLVELRADPELQDQIDTLADRCTEGQLTPEEHEEYGTYVHAIHVIAILQAQARNLLSSQPPA